MSSRTFWLHRFVLMYFLLEDEQCLSTLHAKFCTLLLCFKFNQIQLWPICQWPFQRATNDRILACEISGSKKRMEAWSGPMSAVRLLVFANWHIVHAHYWNVTLATSKAKTATWWCMLALVWCQHSALWTEQGAAHRLCRHRGERNINRLLRLLS